MKRKISLNPSDSTTIEGLFQQFLSASTARGLSAKTIKTYKSHLHCIAKHLDITLPVTQLNKSVLNQMISSMRQSGLSSNSISSYVRAFKSFLTWCREEGYTNVTIPTFKQKDTIKETYSDEELRKLLEKPKATCSFCEYRNWMIVQFLLNSGCRAATIRNIQNRDVDLDSRQVTFRHTKNGHILVIPLCSSLVTRLRGYMQIRKGEPEDYLFCDEYGKMLTENALRLAITRYNKQRGVSKTSIHMFRHTFARKYLMDCGGNAFTLQKLLGHATLEMTKHYCAIFNSDITNGFDNISPLEQFQTASKIAKPSQRRKA